MSSRKGNGGIAVGWKWLAGSLTSVLVLGGGTWMTTVSLDNKEVRSEIAQVKKEIADKGADVREIKKDIEAIKEAQKSQLESLRDAQKDQQHRQEKVDDELEKLKELLQDDHARFRGRPRAN